MRKRGRGRRIRRENAWRRGRKGRKKKGEGRGRWRGGRQRSPKYMQVESCYPKHLDLFTRWLLFWDRHMFYLLTPSVEYK